jgi:glycerol uptake facilitator-like aquaporin
MSLLEGTEMKTVLAEFAGVLLFQFLGGAAAANSSLKGADSLGGLVTAALGNGIALAVCMFFTADVSGAHLNPAITSARPWTWRFWTWSWTWWRPRSWPWTWTWRQG